MSARKIKLEIEMYFDADFVPPQKFEKPTRANNYTSKCALCPFFGWEDDTGFGWCNITAVRDVEEECPIKKFFDQQPGLKMKKCD